jgi:hypothetical protein
MGKSIAIGDFQLILWGFAFRGRMDTPGEGINSFFIPLVHSQSGHFSVYFFVISLCRRYHDLVQP